MDCFCYLCHISPLQYKELMEYFCAFVGGVYGTVADAGQKRKRSSCFACDSEIKHPNNGFKAGHMHAS